MKNNQQLFNELIRSFAELGVDSPQAEARMVFEAIFERDFKYLSLKNFQVSEAVTDKISQIIERRKKHEPIQYILGKASFYNYELIVNENVLIPRAETEIMVEYIIKNIPEKGTLLDIGCGSGTIGVTCAYERSDIQVTAVDISPEALKIAKLNAENYQLKNIKFFESNLFSNVDSKFDFIAANLPYIPYSEYLECPSEVINFEPEIALTTENNGLKLIYQTAEQCSNYLNNNGVIIFENGYNQAAKIVEFLEKLNNFSEIFTIKDYNDYHRFTVAKL